LSIWDYITASDKFIGGMIENRGGEVYIQGNYFGLASWNLTKELKDKLDKIGDSIQLQVESND